MDPTPNAPAAAECPREAPPVHHLAGWILIALVDTTAIASARAPASALAAMCFYAAFNLVAAGLLIMGVATLAKRFSVRRAWLPYALIAAVSAALAYPLLADDLGGLAGRLPSALPLAVWVALLSVIGAQVVPLAAALGSFLARPWIRLAGVVIAVAIAAVNGRIQPQGYTGLHLLATATAATLAGASLRGASFLDRVVPRMRPARIALGAGLAAISIASLVVRPANAVRTHLTRQPSAVIAPFLGWGRGSASASAARTIPKEQREWFASREGRPPIAPSTPPVLPRDPIVLLVGIDSMRADLLADESLRSTLPSLFALRDASTYFTTARSAGASTAPSLASVFSGVYYSQLYWARRAGTNDPLVYPHLDTSPRFPELLTAAGIRTSVFDATGWLVNERGVVRGFEEEISHANMPAREMVDEVISSVKQRSTGALFAFAHLLDAHWPYTSAGEKGTPFKGYLAELAVVDREIGRLVAAMSEPAFADRVCLILMSDHGEGFGEHGVNVHSQNLYDELLRVPLMIKPPHGKPRVVGDPVSLIDLAPTILDLMGVATPGRYMGQSLTGFLRDEKPVLRRPIAAEARLKRGLVMPDGFKVVHDPIAHTFEIFDLAADPGEQNNLYVEGAESSSRRFAVLNAFVHANTLKQRGYKVPYRSW